MADQGSKKMSKGSMQAKPMQGMKGNTPPMAKGGSQPDAASGSTSSGGAMKGKNQK